MKVLGRIVAIALIVGIAFALAWPRLSGNAQDDGYRLSYSAMEPRSVGTEGEPCSFVNDADSFGSTYHQIEFRNQTDEMVGLATLNQGEIVKSESDSSLSCVQTGMVYFPTSNFITVYFDGVRYRSFASTDFPVESLQVVWVIAP